MNDNYSRIKEMFDKTDLRLSDVTSNVLNTNFIKKLDQAVGSYQKNKPNIPPVKTYQLPRIHDNHDTLSYLLFSEMSKIGDLCSFLKFCPTLDTVSSFDDWYLDHQLYIDMDRLKLYILESSNTTIQNIGQVMFAPPVQRLRIHNMMYNNVFVPHGIQRNYEEHDLILEVYVSEELGLDMHLYRYPDDRTDYIGIVSRILQIMRTFVGSYGIDNKNRLKLTLFMSDEKKYISSPGDILSSVNVNSGASYPGKSIEIWRREEFVKVFIHELIHFFNIDFSTMSPGYSDLAKIINSTIRLDSQTSSRDSCNESYTETLAIVIHTYILSKLLKSDFEKLLEREIYFTAYQVCKIIKHFSGRSIRDIFRVKFKQTTSVRSYFLIKYMMLTNLPDFLTLVDKNGLAIRNNISEYAKFVEKCIMSRKYIFDCSHVFAEIDFNSEIELIHTLSFVLF